MTEPGSDDELLELADHRLYAVEQSYSSVEKWRCIDCDREFDEVEDYFEYDCTRDG